MKDARDKQAELIRKFELVCDKLESPDGIPGLTINATFGADRKGSFADRLLNNQERFTHDNTNKNSISTSQNASTPINR